MTAPAPGVLARFGLSDPAIPSEGGIDGVFFVGDAVCKRFDDPLEAGWVAAAYAQLGSSTGIGVRTPAPIRARDGGWVADGWIAYKKLAGAAKPRAWREKLAAAASLHAATAALPWPAFMEDRRDPWSRAQRLVWGGAPIAGLPPEAASAISALRDRLADAPGRSAAQVQHCDLAGNLLFAPKLPPAVIDLSPGYAPAGYADCVLLVDVFAWEGASRGDFVRWTPPDRFEELLLRATLFRVAVAAQLAMMGRIADFEAAVWRWGSAARAFGVG